MHNHQTLLEITMKAATESMKEVTDLTANRADEGVAEISAALRSLLADAFALYLKSKNFHWHMSGPHFRDYHLLLDEHAEQIFATTDDIAERGRKLGGTTLHLISDVSRHQRLEDNNAEFVTPNEMLAELCYHDPEQTRSLR